MLYDLRDIICIECMGLMVVPGDDGKNERGGTVILNLSSSNHICLSSAPHSQNIDSNLILNLPKELLSG